MFRRLPQRQRLHKSVDAKAAQNAVGHATVNFMGMAMLDALGKGIHGNLEGKTEQDEAADDQRLEDEARLRFIQIRQQVQHHQGKQIGAGEGVHQLDLPGVVQPQPEHRAGPQRNARKKDEIIHNNTRPQPHRGRANHHASGRQCSGGIQR